MWGRRIDRACALSHHLSEQPQEIAAQDLDSVVSRISTTYQLSGQVRHLVRSLKALGMVVGVWYGQRDRPYLSSLLSEQVLEERVWLVLAEVGPDSHVVYADPLDQVFDCVDVVL